MARRFGKKRKEWVVGFDETDECMYCKVPTDECEACGKKGKTSQLTYIDEIGGLLYLSIKNEILVMIDPKNKKINIGIIGGN